MGAEDMGLVGDGPKKLYLEHHHCMQAAEMIFDRICRLRLKQPIRIWGVPRGGIPVAYLVLAHAWSCNYNTCQLSALPSEANIIVDDLIDSGATRERLLDLYPQAHFFTLVDELGGKKKGEWVVFPWEVGLGGFDNEAVDTSADDIVVRLLQYIGEDPKREGLQETPKRVLKAWSEWTKGYKADPAKVLKSFQDGAESYDEMITVRNLPFYSMCEHHLAPFFGTATISYIPRAKIVGLSKLGRVLDIFARRLQVQERLTTQIAKALQSELDPLGVAVVVRARHLCMESRGLATQGHETVTTALTGRFRDDPKARQEFLDTALK